MARSNTGSTSNYFTSAAAPVTAAPLSMACWFNAANVTSDNDLICLIAPSNDNYFALGAFGSATADRVGADTGNNSAFPIATSTAAYSANTWHHAAAVWTSATSRAAFLDGGNKGTNSTSCTPSGIDHISVGAYRHNSSGTIAPIDGAIGEGGIWNVALTDAEVAALGRGVSPLLVRPSALVAYWSMIGRFSPEIDLRGNAPLTMAGTMATADHCRIIYPAGFDPLVVKTAASSGRTGSLSQTLAALSLSSAGTVDVAGILAKTLSAVTSSGAGAVDVVGALSATLSALTTSGAGSVEVVGALSQTLAVLTAGGSGAVAVSGSLAQTLAALSLSAAGGSGTSGDLSATLAALSASADGTVAVAGQLAQTLAALSGAGAGQVAIAGQLAATLAAAIGSAVGTVEVAGALAATLGAATLSAAGEGEGVDLPGAGDVWHGVIYDVDNLPAARFVRFGAVYG